MTTAPLVFRQAAAMARVNGEGGKRGQYQETAMAGSVLEPGEGYKQHERCE